MRDKNIPRIGEEPRVETVQIFESVFQPRTGPVPSTLWCQEKTEGELRFILPVPKDEILPGVGETTILVPYLCYQTTGQKIEDEGGILHQYVCLGIRMIPRQTVDKLKVN